MKASKAYLAALKKAVDKAKRAQVDELLNELLADVLEGDTRRDRAPLLERLKR